MAKKRFSRDGKEQVVLERIVNTEWHDAGHLEGFCAEADYAKMRVHGFAELHSRYIESLEELNCLDVTGRRPSSLLSSEERRKILEEIHVIDSRLASLKAQARREGELSRQVELNVEASELAKRRRNLVGRLEA